MVKTQIRHFEGALSTGDPEKANEQFKLLVKRIDKVASTSTMHKNTAARMKSSFARQLNTLKTQKA
jgi:small subunit ribosomal protein S20